MEKFKKLSLVILFFITGCNLKDFSNTPDIVWDQNLNDLKICIFGDSGIISNKQEAVANYMTQENCQITINTGDIIYENGVKNLDDPSLKTKFLGPYSNLIQKSKVLLTLGNHDHRGNINTYLDLAKVNSNIIFPNYFYKLQLNDACIIVIDTNINFNYGQEKWLRNIVENRQKCPRLMAVGHHPYTSSGKHDHAQKPIKTFLEAYIINNVDLYISGHDHQLSLEYINGKPIQVISGSAGEVRKIKNKGISKFQESKMGYVVLEKNLLKFKGIDNNLELKELYEAVVQ